MSLQWQNEPFPLLIQARDLRQDKDQASKQIVSSNLEEFVPVPATSHSSTAALVSMVTSATDIYLADHVSIYE